MSEEAKFKAAFEDVAPKLIDAQSPIWLPEDSVMVSNTYVFHIYQRRDMS